MGYNTNKCRNNHQNIQQNKKNTTPNYTTSDNNKTDLITSYKNITQDFSKRYPYHPRKGNLPLINRIRPQQHSNLQQQHHSNQPNITNRPPPNTYATGRTK